MEKKYVDAATVMKDFDVSRAKAYIIIRSLNQLLKETHPNAIIVAGKVNRVWYDDACLTNQVYSSHNST